MKSANCALLLSVILCTAVYASAQDEETSTEIQGYFRTYRNFSYDSGDSYYNFSSPMKLNGGGFSLARNFAPWFAMWTELSFYGSPEKDSFKIGIINNQQGLRFQTRQHGPFRFYVKGGIGFTRYSIDLVLATQGFSYGDTSLSLGYGGGAQVWMNKNFGLVFDVSHTLMGLPNLLFADLPDREKYDSGLTYSTGFAVRF